MLTLKWAEFLTAWTLASETERSEFQEKHGPIVSPPQLLRSQHMSQSAQMAYPIVHDAKEPVYFRDLDADALRDGKLVRKK